MNCAIGTTFRDRVGRLLACGLRRVLRSNSEGGALVEMAVTLPLIMLMVTGMMSFGVTLNQYLVLTNAVQTGAMELAVNAGTTSDPCATASAAIAAAAPTLSASSITTSLSFNGGSAVTANSCTGSASSLTENSSVVVTATYPTTLNIFGWVPSSFNLSASAGEMVQ